jgi:hypothetical protein
MIHSFAAAALFALALGAMAAGIPVSGPMADEGWLKQAAAGVFTPKSELVARVAVVRTEGRVDVTDNLLSEDNKSCRLT